MTEKQPKRLTATEQERLFRKLMAQAVANGFWAEYTPRKALPKSHQDTLVYNMMHDKFYQHYVLTCHSFARALWGEEEELNGYWIKEEYQPNPNSLDGPAEWDEGFVQDMQPAWQYHLSNLILCEDPIIYLAQHT